MESWTYNEDGYDAVVEFVDDFLDSELSDGGESGLDQKAGQDERLARDENLARDAITAMVEGLAVSDTAEDVPYTDQSVSKMPALQEVKFALEMLSRSLHTPREFLTDGQREELKKIRDKYGSMKEA